MDLDIPNINNYCVTDTSKGSPTIWINYGTSEEVRMTFNDKMASIESEKDELIEAAVKEFSNIAFSILKRSRWRPMGKKEIEAQKLDIEACTECILSNQAGNCPDEEWSEALKEIINGLKESLKIEVD